MSIAKKLAPSELIEKDGVTRSVPKEPETLTNEEKELHARTMSKVDQVLRSHGVSLTGSELHHVSAAIADFVDEEIVRAASAKEEPVEEEEEEVEGEPGKKRRKRR